MKENHPFIAIHTIQAKALEKFTQQERLDWTPLKKVPYLKKLMNERHLKQLIENLVKDLEAFDLNIPDPLRLDLEPSKMKKVKTVLAQYMEELDQQKLLFERPFLVYFMEQGYLDVAESFIAKAKDEDPDLDNEEIFQALRNVWIMNSLQLCLNLPLELTPAIYSYSMLYPYTDNYIDDPSIHPLDKIQFNHRIEQALKGNHVASDIWNEQRISELIQNIEKQYSRQAFPQVFESMQLIHDAQVKSLQQSSQRMLEDDEILELSFYKGGTSVLADGCLIKPNLNTEEASFSFEFGTFLQLLDDLQDIVPDQEENYKTYFNFPRNIYETDRKIEQLIAYIFQVTKISSGDSSTMKRMKEIIRDCTLILIMEAVGSHPSIISTAFYNKLESYSKVRLSFYKELKEHLMEQLPIFMSL